jgi:tetratricopeptide (TPR) repeat protein
MLRRKVTAGAATLALVLVLNATVWPDVITRVPGPNGKSTTVRGDIQSETPSEVKVKLGNSVQTIATDEIASITYTGAPSSLVLAEARENANAFQEAADLYKKAADEASSKPFIQQSALFQQARVTAELALTNPAKTPDAVRLLSAFTKAYPNGRHVSAALESLARLQLNKGDYAQAEKTISDLAKQPAGADRAAVLRSRINARKGDHETALKELNALIKGAPEGSLRQREARLAKAESLAALKKYAEAETEAKAVIKALPPEDVQGQALAYNTLGDCLRAADKPKDALKAYLHTDILFFKDKEQHPRALANIARLWREIKRDDRADEVEQKLRQDYPNSPWVAYARGRDE